ncbi:MAG: nucleotidyltransferase family protein [Myxococcales bacterium]|nr:nucleotidyltransferase family protein [Myxococcales bacterium]
MAELTGGRSRAWLDMGGRVMVERVLDGLQAAQSVDEIVVVGLAEHEVDALRPRRPVHFLPEQGTMVGNAMAGLLWIQQRAPDAATAMLCSMDIPLIRGAAVDHFVESCRPFDHLFFQAYVTSEVMQAAHPGVRSYSERWREHGVVYAGDVFVVGMAILATNPEVWEAFERHAWREYPALEGRVSERFGEATWRRLVAGETSDEEDFRVILSLLGGEGAMKNVFTPHDCLALDADSPELVEYLRRRLRGE